MWRRNIAANISMGIYKVHFRPSNTLLLNMLVVRSEGKPSHKHRLHIMADMNASTRREWVSMRVSVCVIE